MPAILAFAASLPIAGCLMEYVIFDGKNGHENHRGYYSPLLFIIRYFSATSRRYRWLRCWELTNAIKYMPVKGKFNNSYPSMRMKTLVTSEDDRLFQVIHGPSCVQVLTSRQCQSKCRCQCLMSSAEANLNTQPAPPPFYVLRGYCWHWGHEGVTLPNDETQCLNEVI